MRSMRSKSKSKRKTKRSKNESHTQNRNRSPASRVSPDKKSKKSRKSDNKSGVGTSISKKKSDVTGVKSKRASEIREQRVSESNTIRKNREETNKMLQSLTKTSPAKAVMAKKSFEPKPKSSGIGMMIKAPILGGEKGKSTEKCFYVSEKDIIGMFKSFLVNLSTQSKMNSAAGSSRIGSRSMSMAQVTEPGIDSVPEQEGPGPDDFVQEFEHLEYLYEDLKELLKNVKIIQKSYQEIVTSLINLQGKPRRQIRILPETASELAANASKIKPPPPAMPPSGAKQSPEAALELFMNPHTRDNAFRDLFGRVEKVKSDMGEFLKSFGPTGKLVPDQYRDERRITYRQYLMFHTEIADIAAITDVILREYNQEVLELFRLSKSKMSSEPSNKSFDY